MDSRFIWGVHNKSGPSPPVVSFRINAICDEIDFDLLTAMTNQVHNSFYTSQMAALPVQGEGCQTLWTKSIVCECICLVCSTCLQVKIMFLLMNIIFLIPTEKELHKEKASNDAFICTLDLWRCCLFRSLQLQLYSINKICTCTVLESIASIQMKDLCSFGRDQ